MPDRAPLLGRSGPLAVAAAAVALAVLWPSVATLAAVWQEIHDYQHGWLIAAIAVLWFARLAQRHWPERARPSLLATAVLGLLLLFWMVALSANSMMIHQLLLPAVIWTAVWAAAGWRAARVFLPPVAFLYFATPVWDYGMPVLQRQSVLATETLLALIGVPAEVHEYSVTIPEGTFNIVEGCSGKRYLVVTLAVAMLAAAVHRMPRWHIVAYVAASGALALLMNWLRIAVVIYAGHVTDMQHYLVTVEHNTFGNVLFAVLLVAVFALGHFVARHAEGVPRPRDAVAELAIPPPWRSAAPLALLLAVLVWTEARAAATQTVAEIGGLPVAASRWQGPLPPSARWMPQYEQPDGERRAAYRSEAGAVELYAGVYGEQRQGRELIAYGNSLLGAEGWRRTWPQRSTRIGSAPAPLEAFEALDSDGGRWVIAYTFEVGGWPITSEPLVQVAYGLRTLFGPAPAGVVALAARCSGNCEAARALVASFWDDMSGPVLGIVPDGGRSR